MMMVIIIGNVPSTFPYYGEFKTWSTRSKPNPRTPQTYTGCQSLADELSEGDQHEQDANKLCEYLQSMFV